MHPRVACPKCSRPLAAEGEIIFHGETFPVYQCDECVNRCLFDGQSFETSLTFIIDRDGNVVDPTQPDGRIDLTPHD